jgi:fatty acid desaturase
MPDHHTPPTRSYPTIPTPRWTTVLAGWPKAIAVAMLLELFVMTIRAAVHEQGAPGVWATIAFCVLVGGGAAHDVHDCAHGDLPPRRHKW